MSGQRITTKTQLLNTIAQCSLNAQHVVPLLMASYRDEISLVGAHRGAKIPLRILDRAKMPSVVLIGDDYGDGLDLGPAGWPGLPRVTRWARLAIINATGGVREHYEQFVTFATDYRKLLVVETGTARADAWLDVCRVARVPTIVMRPEDGGIQPAMPSRGTMH